MARKTMTIETPHAPPPVTVGEGDVSRWRQETDPTNPTGDPDAGFDSGPGGQETHCEPVPEPTAAEPPPADVDSALKAVNAAKSLRDKARRNLERRQGEYDQALAAFKAAAARAE